MVSSKNRLFYSVMLRKGGVNIKLLEIKLKVLPKILLKLGMFTLKFL